MFVHKEVWEDTAVSCFKPCIIMKKGQKWYAVK